MATKVGDSAAETDSTARDLVGFNFTARILGKLFVGCTRKLEIASKTPLPP